jgi:hypothetical protein
VRINQQASGCWPIERAEIIGKIMDLMVGIAFAKECSVVVLGGERGAGDWQLGNWQILCTA